jgi:hypothetical protein
MGELVGMPPPLDYERSGDKMDRILMSQPDPQVIVLADWKLLVEDTDLRENLAAEEA